MKSLRAFNPSKTQLIRFSRSPSSTCTACFVFCGQHLSFLDTVTHLGHLLHYNLSDAPDINHKLRDMVKKANCLLASFLRLVPLFLHAYFSLTAFLFMVRLFGHFPVLPYITLRLPSIRYCVEFGVSLIVATQA